jgi:curli production assembly/transport component CsgF
MGALPKLALGFFGLAAAAGSACASQLTYAPVNPTFGGNPLNGTFLLNSGQAQGHGRAGSATPDLSGLNNAISNLGSNLGGVGSPIIIVNPGSTPTNP